MRELVRQLEVHGCLVERVSVPFKWYPKQELMAHAAAWRLLDLSESCGRPIDLVIPTKFPTYCVRHPRKVTWLMHQYRAAYDLCGTEYADFDHREEDTAVRERIRELDREMLGECAGGLHHLQDDLGPAHPLQRRTVDSPCTTPRRWRRDSAPASTATISFRSAGSRP